MNSNQHTERLTLRPLSMDDLDIALEIFTDHQTTRFISGPFSAEEVTKKMPSYVQRCGNGCIGMWCVLDKSTQEKLGIALLLPIPIEKDGIEWDRVEGPNIPDGDIEIGYVLKPSAWGKGFATETCKRLLNFAFEETPLTEVVATFDDLNLESRHVLQKSGLSDCGKRFCYAEENCPDFRITRDEWIQNQTK